MLSKCLLLFVFFSTAFTSLLAQWLVDANYVNDKIMACNRVGSAAKIEVTLIAETATNASIEYTFPTEVSFTKFKEVSAEPNAPLLGLTTNAVLGDKRVVIKLPDKLTKGEKFAFEVTCRAECDAADYKVKGGSFF